MMDSVMGLLFLFPWWLISSSIWDSEPTKTEEQKHEGGEGITFCRITKKCNPSCSSSSTSLLLLGVACATAGCANASLEPRGGTILRWEDKGGFASLQKFKIMDFFFTNLLTKLFANFFPSTKKILMNPALRKFHVAACNTTVKYTIHQDGNVHSFIAQSIPVKLTLLVNTSVLFKRNSALSCQQGRWSEVMNVPTIILMNAFCCLDGAKPVTFTNKTKNNMQMFHTIFLHQ